MKKSTRFLVLLLSLCLGAGYFLPLWDIILEAPQYPEGLGMQIWLSKLSGDLNTINGLNHYIGMKEIIPESIPELIYLPYVLGGLIAIGLIVFISNKRTLLYTWTIILLLFGVLMAIDFYMWEYDYGHDLDPRAAIKVPGMNYQPPLWGSKVLLNFTAHSYPATGGWAIIIGVAGAALLSIYEFKTKKKLNTGRISFATLILMLPMLTSCSPDPLKINYANDVCSHCKMSVVDQKFGAGMVTLKGKKFTFDSIECLVEYLNEKQLDEEKFAEIKVTNYMNPGSLISASTAVYLRSEKLPSPMGGYLTAYSSLKNAQEMKTKNGGEIMDWTSLKKHLLK